MVESLAPEPNRALTKVEQHLIQMSPTEFTAYYNGKMSYKLHGTEWNEFVAKEFASVEGMITSENIFKTVVDLYAENLVPAYDELRGFSNCLVPLITTGECVVLKDPDGKVRFPEHFKMMSDGNFTIAVIYTRNLELMFDYITFAYSNGTTRLFRKPIPDDFGKADYSDGFSFVEEQHSSKLFRFALDDKGIGASLAALQDRANHSIIDQTVIAEMYARPFWYLLNVQDAPYNPFLPENLKPDTGDMKEKKTSGGAGRIFTSSSDGPFGQLEPPTISDMISYHDSIVDKVPQSFGIPAHYLKPGTGTPPTGVALKVLSKRFNNRIARMREDIEPVLEELAREIGIQPTKEVKQDKPKKNLFQKVVDAVTGHQDPAPEMEYEFWNTDDDLLQEALDAHGISLSQMGYPLEYIASVVTPGVDLKDYQDDALGAPVPQPGAPVDMTAMGQTGTPATPGQVEAYRQNPGQRATGQ